ncbi:MAG: hypothetical protein AMS19_13205 [Gemmatimonas sp. SG8_23]|nr:MAG: hypothetical protein AMS19_13205 [Gemmatimonas sp. SG8_23]
MTGQSPSTVTPAARSLAPAGPPFPPQAPPISAAAPRATQRVVAIVRDERVLMCRTLRRGRGAYERLLPAPLERRSLEEWHYARALRIAPEGPAGAHNSGAPLRRQHQRTRTRYSTRVSPAAATWGARVKVKASRRS